MAARLAGRATAEDLPVPLPAAVLVQVARMPCCALGYLGVICPKINGWNLKIFPKGTGKSSELEPSTSSLGVPAVSFRGCVGILLGFQWEGRGTSRLVVSKIFFWGQFLAPTYVGKWIQLEGNIVFDWVET